MPAHLNLVTIRTASGLTVIPWDSRDALLERMRGDTATQGLRSAFIAAGATRPPDLLPPELVQLFHVLDEWLIDASQDSVPEGILKLWSTLTAELRDLDDPRD
jgi:hypothetical protein